MAAIKTIDFLPEVFRTTPNEKFLSATLDQLVSEPNFKKINGYVGRKFAPTFKVGDNYLTEPNLQRQQYQLEPCVTVTDSKGDVDFFSSYTDLLQKIDYYGGQTDNHSRLFDNEYYSFDGLVDFDKLVNFNQYYWLPNGPDTVEIRSGAVDTKTDFTVAYDANTLHYLVSGKGASANPDLVLARGGSYTFTLDTPGANFWIQTEPGTSGQSSLAPTISTRSILGVGNNGDDVGTITFEVPQASAQDFYIEMPTTKQIDLATTLSYNEIQGKLASTFAGIDGQTSQLGEKYIVFAQPYTTSAAWTGPDIVDGIGGGVITNPALEILQPQWHGVWQIKLVTMANSDVVIDLVWIEDIPMNNKVYVKAGDTYAAREFFKNAVGTLTEVPVLTAPLTTLYYQDGSNPSIYGKIRLVDVHGYAIEVETEVVGKKNYTSPNGVVFSNGLKVKFDETASPASYANNTFYVEGVGTSIALINVKTLVTPELNVGIKSIPYDIYSYDIDRYDESLNGPIIPDYITINRASLDSNPWSRSNRWVHGNIIKQTAFYNDTPQALDQLDRAARPIVEFNAGLRLFNTGVVARHNVEILDFSIVDALNQVEGSESLAFFGLTVRHGMRVIFANDNDPAVRNKIYVMQILDINGVTRVHLILADDPQIEKGDNVVTVSGHNQGTSFWYNGDQWLVGQQKTRLNQSPKFDVYDSAGISLGDKNVYNNSSFAGTTVFEYKTGTGRDDTVLGFPLSYRNFNNVGDIEFSNNFDTQTFSYLTNKVTVSDRIAIGHLHQTFDGITITKRNTWIKNKERSKQYQVISAPYTGETKNFEIDISPEVETSVPYTKVYVNGKLLPASQYSTIFVGVRQAIQISSTLTVGDNIDILIYSNQVSNLGHYEVPLNLDYNTLNKDFSSLTLGQFRNHLTTLAGNHNNITGSVPGNSNIRDLTIKDHGGSILQHSAPTVYSSLFLIDNDMNFVNGIEHAQKEYTKFKNKFLELALGLSDQNIFDPRLGTDTILRTVNAVKNSNSPWYYSDMVPYDENKTVTEYTVINSDIVEYEISAIFQNAKLSNRAVLVYYNGAQLLVDKDFYFNQDRASIVLTIGVQADDTLVIHEYHNTDGCYIPETPTKLGLYPKFTPAIFIDDTYNVPTKVIQGHDGSIIPAFNDYRDALVLELEYRIYNNIKVGYTDTLLDFHQYSPGKFRDSDYTRTEFNQILTGSFLKWIGNNRVDYTSNSYFVANDPWTWNYSGFQDTVTGAYLPGFWRGIYKHFYDTDRPHTHPWEMLGFSEQPTWWEENYGQAPYTGGNQILWDDLEAGRILEGTRAGIDPLFARPGLSKIIPVDDFGDLRSPEKFAVKNFNSLNASGNFAVGDQAPVESAWRRSSEYPFALQQTIALSKPGVYFGVGINVYRYHYDAATGQILNELNQRITPRNIVINGETANGTITRSIGYLNWIADYLRSMGINPITKLRSYLNNLDIKLGYKVAGYTDKSYLKVLAEQSSPSSVNESVVIPDENYKIYLHKSTPTRRLVYSAVIIERSTNGYTVTGYDLTNPHFAIIPSNPNSNQTSIKVGNDSAVIYRDYKNQLVSIPYGTEFKNKQQLVDFLVSYGRFLTAQGFLFNDYDTDLQAVRDWVLSAREFLTWSQQGWTAGNVVVVSPAYNSLKVYTGNSTVDEITNASTGSKILDAGFNVVKKSQFTVNRSRNRFEVATTSGETMAFVDLNLVQYEHALIFDNATIFNDIIYSPELGNRQFRLKIIGNKTGDWAGQLDPAGFIYSDPIIEEWSTGRDYLKGDLVLSKNNYYVALQKISAAESFNFNLWKQLPANSIKKGLMPNFAYNAQKFINIYDIDNQIADNNINVYSNGLIGYRDRSYLTALSLDSETQSRFYQGYIKEKGTKNAFDALANAKFSNLQGNIKYYEEWAVRVGEYGAINSNQSIELTLAEDLYTNNPNTFALLDSGDTVSDEALIGVNENNLYRKPAVYSKDIFRNRTSESDTQNDIRTAGYVNTSDVDATIFNIGDYSSLDEVVGKIGNGFKIWVAKDVNRDWNVYRIAESKNHVVGMSYALNEYASIETALPHGLVVGEVFAVRGFDALYDGFYRVDSVETNNKVTVINQHQTELKLAKTVTGSGILFKLHTMRFDYASDVAGYTPKNGWKKNDRIWVDNDTGTDSWAVYQKSDPWAYGIDLDLEELDYVSNGQTGRSVKIADNKLIALVGSPGSGQGNVQTFVKLSTGEYVVSQKLLPNNPHSEGMGHSVDLASDIAVVGAPNSVDGGHVFVYRRAQGSAFSLLQILSSPTGAAGDRFGEALALSRDGKWLYVGAPGANLVQVYTIEQAETEVDVITTTPGVVNYELAFIPHSEKSFVIRNQGTTLVYGLDYTYDSGTNEITTFVAPTTVTQYIVTQDLYFDNVYTLSTADAMDVGDGYGTSVQTSDNGEQIIVGAPGREVGSIVNAGTAYVYDRHIHNCLGDGSNLEFSTGQEYVASKLPRVFVDGVEQFAPSNYSQTASHSITFILPPANHAVVRIETNHFSLLKTIEPPMPTYNARFGYSVEIGGNSKTIFVGAPGHTTATYNGGSVFRYVNDGQLYSTVLSTPIITPITIGDSIRINGYNVEFTSNLAQAVQNINAAAISGVIATNSEIDINGTIIAFASLAQAVQNINAAAISGVIATNSEIDIDGIIIPFSNLAQAVQNINAADIPGVIATPISISINGTIIAFSNLAQAVQNINAAAISGVIATPISISINGTIIAFVGAKNCADSINAASIPGVTAAVETRPLSSPPGETTHLRITIDTSRGSPELYVLPGSGTALADLGITAYTMAQEIRSPFIDEREDFGHVVRYDATTETLVVSSQGGTTFDPALFDDDTTAFDGTSTTFFSATRATGAVYIMELMDNPLKTIDNPSNFVYSQQLRATGMDPGDNFGTAIDIVGGIILVGAPLSDDALPMIPDNNAGSVYRYVATGINGWHKIRAEEPKVDLESLRRTFIYSKKTQTILSNLDYIDPAKGKVLGAAEQDLDFKTSYDPARYNSGTRENVSIDPEYHWGKQYVGRTWWDLDAVRYIDYEQGSLSYRANNWGRQFEGSSIDVYEWVESSVPPSEYNGEGTPKHADNSAYVDITSVDPVSKIIMPRYYFWVKDKRSFDAVNTTRTLSTAAIAEMIDNPKAEPIAYAALIRSDSMALFNVGDLTEDNDTILHVGYAVTDTDNLVHAEYELVQENNGNSLFPRKIVTKLIDSLAGADRSGRNVPDVLLPMADRFGISVRPRQTMVANRTEAVKNFVNYVNTVFAKNILVNQFDLSALFAVDPIPNEIAGPWDIKVSSKEELSYVNTAIISPGTRVLVEQNSDYDNLWTISEVDSSKNLVLARIQSYNTTNFWDYVDWYATDFDPSIKATYTVDTEKDLARLTVADGDTLHVRNNGSGQFVIYAVESDLSLSLVGLQNGTIQLSDALYKQEANQYGYDNESYDTTLYDFNPSVEFGHIFEAIYNDIFTGPLNDEKSKLMFMLVNYIMSEQKSIDWIFKTSFISVIHKLRKLEQFPSFLRDNQDYYQDYINEVKPYRTKIREYLIDYEGQDDATMVATDFDLPPYYDADYNSYRSPNGEKARDALLLSTQPEYSDWYNHHSLEISSAVVSNPGSGYILEPEVTVVGGGGSGAIITARIDAFLGTIVSLIVVNPGSGYTSTPTIVINGTGTGGKAYAQLANTKVRGFSSRLKFDRVGYDSNVVLWDQNITIPSGSVVAYNRIAYKTESEVTTDGFFDVTQFVELSPDEVELLSANDRTMIYYRPTVGMTAKDLKQLFTGIEYRGVKLSGSKFDEDPGYDIGNYDVSPYDNVEFDDDGLPILSITQLDTQIQSYFADAALGTRPEDVIVDGAAFVDTWNSHAPEELLPGIVFDTLDMKVFTERADLSVIGYRIVKTMTGTLEYRRITAENTTSLAADLLLTDATITVSDLSALPEPSPELARPGIVYINGEKITYYTIDPLTNTLGQIRRAVDGTGAPAVHVAGSQVVDASLNQSIPAAEGRIWLNGGGTTSITDGQGLEHSTTAQGMFINAKESYAP